MATNVIVLASRQSSTGFAKDQFENVFHFTDPDALGAVDVATVGCNKINDFFTKTGGSGPSSIVQFLNHTQGELFTLTAYDAAAALPRPELFQAKFTYGSPGSSDMPEEIALCLSYYTDRNVASHRGRLYIGPLNIGAINSLVNDPARPKDNLVSCMAAAGGRLILPGEPATAPGFTIPPPGGTSATTRFALYSPHLGTYTAVGHGWVDNEWDGQSRRRVEASSRTTF